MDQKKEKRRMLRREYALYGQEAFVFSCVLSFALPLFGKK